MRVIFAHAGAVSASPSMWDAAVLALLTLGAVLYAVGSRRLEGRLRASRAEAGPASPATKMRRLESAAFWAGWATLVAGVAPPLDGAASATFSAHMAQHELLMLVGAPLMVAGRPVVPWLWALGGARFAAAAVLQNRGTASIWQWATLPVTAWVLHAAAIWIWHAPMFYEAAVRHEALHAVQHATFVGTAVLFWWGLLYGRYGRAAYGAAVLYVFTTAIHTGALGALFTFAALPMYPLYVERAAALGIDAVTDQQLAGLYMWVPAGVVLTVFGLALFMAWLAESDRSQRAQRKQRAQRMIFFVSFVPFVSFVSAACTAIPYENEARRLTGGDPYHGRTAIRTYGCDSCHTIPGVATADALVGPPLNRMASRTIIAGRFENTPENMLRWIRQPHVVEPGTAMPDTGVSEQDGRDIVAYLYTLR
jgi:cytochrome c oxidase assembly factor CtaG/cytochrome c2